MSIFDKEEAKEKDCFADKVKCAECKCWVDKTDAQNVQYTHHQSYYCQAHKMPYDRTFTLSVLPKDIVRYYKKMGEMEVDKKGNLLGYKKIKLEHE